MSLFLISVLALAVAVTAAPKQNESGVRVDCRNGTVGVSWTVGPQVDSSRVFLGSCFQPELRPLPDGSTEMVFNVGLNDCRIRRQITGKWVIFKTTLTYKPLPKPQPPMFTFPVECFYRRPTDMFTAVRDPALGSAFGYGSLLFYMGIANEDFSGPAPSSTFPLGSFIPVWAAVDQQAHLPLLLLLDQCVATNSPEPDASGPIYPIITNHGCLVDSQRGSSRFQPRRQSSELLLLLQAFRFAPGQEVYLHCTLVAWDPQHFSKARKTCHYSQELGGWELLDDPSQNSLCSCCDSRCTRRERRDTDQGSLGINQKAVLGPFTIVDSHLRSPNQCAVTEQGDRTL